MSQQLANGVGLSWTTDDGDTLDAWYPFLQIGPAASRQVAGNIDLDSLARHDPVRRVRRVVVECAIDLAEPPASCIDVYLRLHLLSHRMVKPGELNLDGLFAILPNVVWTSEGPSPVDGFDQIRLALLAESRAPLRVHGVDKIPAMTDYVLPSNVRIADASRVRLGAYLAPGTTVMHEGFINFNAGTLGPSMVEGRISQGVVVGADSDIGGGASIMGTLSGGGKERIRIGARTLLGANSGVGISVGDDCVVEAGLYLTAGTKLTLPDGRVAKASELSDQPGWLFRRNSLTGAVEAVRRQGQLSLNPQLHAN
jgi:2,3,4,5-tetrahydropyridine-2-carboxylate N-succinyltransferase